MIASVKGCRLTLPNMHLGLRFSLSVRWLIIDGVIGAGVGMSTSRIRMCISVSVARLCMRIRMISIVIVMVTFCASKTCFKVVLVGLEPLYPGFLFC